MEYVIIILLVINIILTISKKQKNIDVIEKFNKLELNLTKMISEFKYEINRDLNSDFDKLKNTIENRFDLISQKVNERIDSNFEKSNETFMDILKRLTIIDNAQRKIEELGTNISSLQNVLTDKKTRGIFGEVSLNHILYNVFGENDKLYKIQYKLSNNYIADSVVFAPKPLGTVAIDSKFPLENYQNMLDKTLSLEERKKYEKLFKIDFKKHIDAISEKYIIKGETSDQAIMFLPAEAIFAEVNAYHQDLINYSYQKRVWVTSPTTLISTLTVIEMIVKNIERDKYTSIIHEELNKLGNDFRLYKERWNKLSRSIETVNKDIESVHITTEKISKKFENISQVKLDKNLIEEENDRD